MSTGQIVGGVVGGIVGFVAGAGTPAGVAQGVAYGAAIGGALDPPPGPKLDGPRIDDDSAQTSEYGAPIAHINGKIDAIGKVIWVEGGKMKIIAVETDNEGSKGGGDAGTTETDEAFWTGTVVLADHLVDGIGRVWFGSNLVSNGLSEDLDTAIASGELFPTFSLQSDTGLLKSSLNTNPESGTIRVYPGYDDQPVDPRYEASLGAGKASAWRGYTTMFVYNMPLKDYGNSIAGMPIKVELIVNGANEAPLLLNSITVDHPEPDSNISYWGNCAYLNSSEAVIWFPYNSGAPEKAYKVEVSADGYTRIGISVYSASGRGFGQGWSDNDNGPYSKKPLAAWPLAILDDTNGRFVFKNGVEYGRSVFTGKIYAGPYSLTTPPDTYAMAVDDSGNVYLVLSTGISKYDSTLTLISTKAITFSESYANRDVEAMWDSGTGLLWLMFASAEHFYAVDYDSSITSTLVVLPAITPAPEANPKFHINGGVLTRFYYDHNPNYIATLERWRLPVVDGSGQSLATVTRERLEQSKLIEPDDIDVTLLTDTVKGFKTSGYGSIRSAISVLTAGYPFDMIDAGYQLKSVPRGQSSVMTIDYNDLDARPDGASPGVALPSKYEMAKQLPRRVDLGFLDSARNYDKNVQPSIERLASTAVNIESFDLALVFDVDEAAQRANYEIDRKSLERRSFGPFFLPQTYQALEAADVITIPAPEATYELRLTEVNHLADGRVQCAGVPNDSTINIQNAVGGQGVLGDTTISYAGPSIMHLLDIPLIRDEDNKAGFAAALSGKSSGWPGGNITRSLDSGQTWKSIQSFRSHVTAGVCRDSLPAHDGCVIDRSSILTVDLYSSAMTISSITEDQMMIGKNYFAYGVDGRWEIGRFVNATLNVDGSYTLDTFIRGAKGSELYTDDHIDGDKFIFLADADAAFIAANVSDIGVDRLYRGVTTGKNIDTATDTTFKYAGVNLKPLSPVQLSGSIDGSNNWDLTWLRRSRLSSSWWVTGVAPVVGEDSEAYEIDIVNGSTVVRTLTATTGAVEYTSADQVTDFGSNQTTLNFRIYQLSTIVGRGFVAEITL
ncbi:MAG: hypothetical protein COB36_10790 [Alphaproteobacteria bacterium]|nr:MAG: hypothetical protein COB36_10790 [Alphaproteobacteria bacterium]